MSNKVIHSIFHKEDRIISTEIAGITLQELESYAKGTRCSTLNFWDSDNENYYIPGAMIISLFRHVVEQLAKEKKGFPLAKIESFSGANGEVKENRVYIGESLKYNFVFLSNVEKRFQFKVEVIRPNTEIVLQGIFQYI